MKLQPEVRAAVIKALGKRFCQNCQRERDADGFIAIKRNRVTVYVCAACQKHKGK